VPHTLHNHKQLTASKIGPQKGKKQDDEMMNQNERTTEERHDYNTHSKREQRR
jgi:hypothetical protein